VVLRVLVTQLLLAALVGVAFVVLYAGLQRDPQPQGLPVAVVGQSSANPVGRVLGSAVTIVVARDDAAARQSVIARDRIAAFSAVGPELIIYVAGPNGLAENGAAEALGSAVAKAQRLTPRVIDLVPLGHFDPRGLAGFYTVLGVTVGSFILAQALYAVRALTGIRDQLVAMTAFAVLIATAVALIAGPWLQLLPLPVLVAIPLLALLSLAVSATARALTAWFGPFGITAATLLMTAVGLSISGGVIGQDLLPPPLGVLGSVLPAGAALRALVDLSYFTFSQAFPSIAVLALWAGVGIGGFLLENKRIKHAPTSGVSSAIGSHDPARKS